MSKFPQPEVAYQQAVRLASTNQKQQAVDTLNDYFTKARIRQWDSQYEKMAQLGLKLSAETQQVIPMIVRSYISFACEYSFVSLSESINKFLDECLNTVTYAEERAEEESKNNTSELLAHTDIKQLLKESIVDSAIEFNQITLKYTLEYLIKFPKAIALTYQVFVRAYKFAQMYQSEESYSAFSGLLSMFRTLSPDTAEKSPEILNILFKKVFAARSNNMWPETLHPHRHKSPDHQVREPGGRC